MKFNKKIFLQKTILVSFLLSFVIVSILIFTAVRTIFNYYSYSWPTDINNSVTRKIQIKPGLPKKLKIPSINLDVSIEYVGLTSDGVMNIGPNADIVGWYMLGPRPGDDGSAVIAGHYGWTNGKPAVFNDIQTLKKGAELSVVDQKGIETNFIVRETRKYNPKSDATYVFQSDDGNAHLNLITCNGVWENDEATYSGRLVVFTDKK